MSDNVIKLDMPGRALIKAPPQGVTVHAEVENVQPNQGLVVTLEKMLAMAKTGRLQCLVGTGFTDDGQRVSLISDIHKNVHEMLGAIAWLQQEYITKVTNRNVIDA